MQLFRVCRDAADSKLNTRARARGLSSGSWSSKGPSNFFLQPLPLANLKGLGHLFMVAAASIRAVLLSSNVAVIGGNSTLEAWLELLRIRVNSSGSASLFN